MNKKPPLPKKPDLTSWAVVDSQGRLDEAHSHLAHMREDPASTTKLWTLYTILTKMKNGELPSNFLYKEEKGGHAHLVESMMIRSDNSAAIKLAELASTTHDASGAVVEKGSVKKFTDTMTQLAKQKGMDDTQFITPCGMPQEGHYSTAADMALAVVRFQQDFPKRKSWLVQSHTTGVDEYGCHEGGAGTNEQCDNTNRQMRGQHDIVGGKTGTGNSEFINAHGGKGYGSEGRLAFVGITNHSQGAFSVLGANTKDERNRTAFAAADNLNAVTRQQEIAAAARHKFEVAHVENHAAPAHTPTWGEAAISAAMTVLRISFGR